MALELTVSQIVGFNQLFKFEKNSFFSIQCIFGLRIIVSYVGLYLSVYIGLPFDEVRRQVINKDNDNDDGHTGDCQVDNDHRPHLDNVVIGVITTSSSSSSNGEQSPCAS